MQLQEHNERLTKLVKSAWIETEEVKELYYAKCREHTEIVGQLSKKLSKVQKDKETMARLLYTLGYPQYWNEMT